MTKLYKLHTEQGRQLYKDDKYPSFGIMDYLKKGVPDAVFRDKIITTGDDLEIIVVSKNMIYHSNELYLNDFFEQNDFLEQKTIIANLNKFTKDIPIGVIVPKRIPGVDMAFGVIFNGDEDNNYLVDYDPTIPVISFRCLSRFFLKPTEISTAKIKTVLKKLVQGEIEIIDYTPNELIPMTNKEAKQWRNFDKAIVGTPPQPPKKGLRTAP